MGQIALDIGDGNYLDVQMEDNTKKIHEMTLSAFLNHSQWVAYEDPDAEGEAKGNYKLLCPDGSHWPGGWIGKHRTEEAAKRYIHRREVQSKIYVGIDVAEHVVSDYPDLKYWQDIIRKWSEQIEIKKGPYGRVFVNDEWRYFCIEDYPLYGRVEQREFVRLHQLVPIMNTNQVSSVFDPKEAMVIAMYRKLYPLIGGPHWPHLKVKGYNDLKDHDVVRFQIPLFFSDDGYVLEFEEKTGKVIDHFSYLTKQVRLENGKVQALFPSMLLEIIS